MKDLKYFAAFILPLATWIGIKYGGLLSYGPIIIAFLIIPSLELILKPSIWNHNQEDESSRSNNILFDYLIYLNLPVYFLILVYFFTSLSSREFALYETIGIISSVGLLVGTIGINVAHELGHRDKKHEQLMALSLLMTSLYMHFYIEHNKGHHKNVATKEDPSSAKYNESLYAFWFRSLVYSWLGAWKIEAKELKKAGISVLSIDNKMIQYLFIQLTYLVVVFTIFGTKALIFAIIIALIGAILLETINYVEHYGLSRKKLDSGIYEPVREIHSWNSDHQIGRIFLYELTRHSDHHYKSTRKYQILRHFEQSPQLPYGYPGSMLLALVSPLWFKVMNKELQKYQ
jgi:alkane 1-monooxygenase